MDKDLGLYADREFTVEFYDVDSMQIVWHGNYIKFFELGRCELLDKIGFGYLEMEKSGFGWPVVDIKVKYIRPLMFHQKARIRTTLVEYENRIRLSYKIFDMDGNLTTKGESTQMAVDMRTLQSCFESPACLTTKVEACLAAQPEPVEVRR